LADATSQKTSNGRWSEEVKDKAKDLYLTGLPLEGVSIELDVPYSTLEQWKATGDWTLELVAAQNDQALDAFDGDLSVQNTARANLLRGYRLLSNVGEEALQDDRVRFRDKKQAADVMMEGMKGEVELESVALTMEFFREIAQIIREEVTDDDTLRRLAIRLTEVGNVYNNRFESIKSA